jgi:hypothetical protein
MSLRAALAGLVLLALPLAAVAEAAALAIVIRDRAALRAAPRGAAPANALLWQGETLEVRGERLDYLQVYDYRRERGGFVLASEVQRISLRPQEAPELLSIVRFLRGMPGAEALGIGFAAAYVEAAPAEVLASEVGVEALDALGGFAERLAERASSSTALERSAQAKLAGHLDVAARYGVGFIHHEREGRAYYCYEGEAYRRVLAMPSSPAQRARAALALTRAECTSAELRPEERRRMDQWRGEVLDRVDAAALPAHLRNRILMRRAAVWAGLAYLQARKGEPAQASAHRALAALADVDKAKFGDDDARAWTTRDLASPPRPGRRGKPACCWSTARTTRVVRSRGAAPMEWSGRLRRASTARAARSRWRCSPPPPGASSGSSAGRRTAGACACCRLLPPRRTSATPNLPVGFRVGTACSWRARPAATAGTGAASRWCGSTRLRPCRMARRPRACASSSAGRTPPGRAAP